VWWLPELHDLGLLIGSCAHGLIQIDRIRQDSALPFTDAAIRARIQRLRVCEGGDSPVAALPREQYEELLQLGPSILPRREVIEER
jgi:hypothetical protein